MNTRRNLLILVALVLLLIVGYQQFFSEAGPPPSETMDVVVAKSDIPPYSIITASDIMTASVPTLDEHPYYHEEKAVVGMMTGVELREGNKIRRDTLLSVDDNWVDDSTADMLIGSFEVATAHIIGGQLRPGHHIDLLATRRETNDQEAESRWLARDLWVVGVYQAGGDNVARPQTEQEAAAAAASVDGSTSAGAFGTFAGGGSSSSDGPANLVVVAVPRETARMISDYLGARYYDAWVYVRPGGYAVTKGRIDGLVFDDVEPDLIQQRFEAGLDDVRIVLKTDKGVEVATARTASGGQFTFDDVATGVYYVEEFDPAGYDSLSANRLRVEVSAGQNLHVQFADVAEPPAAPTPEPTAIDLPCAVSAHISEQSGGGAKSRFGYDTKEVWVEIDWQECDPSMPYAVTAYYVPQEGDVQQIDSGTWGGAVGSKSLLIKAWQGGQFLPGSYIAKVYVADNSALAAVASWTVEEKPPSLATALPQPTPVVVATAVPNLPTTGEQPVAPEPVTEFGFGHGR